MGRSASMTSLTSNESNCSNAASAASGSPQGVDYFQSCCNLYDPAVLNSALFSGNEMMQTKAKIAEIETEINQVKKDPNRNLDFLTALQANLTALQNKENLLLQQSTGILYTYEQMIQS